MVLPLKRRQRWKTWNVNIYSAFCRSIKETSPRQPAPSESNAKPSTRKRGAWASTSPSDHEAFAKSEEPQSHHGSPVDQAESRAAGIGVDHNSELSCLHLEPEVERFLFPLTVPAAGVFERCSR